MKTTNVTRIQPTPGINIRYVDTLTEQGKKRMLMVTVIQPIPEDMGDAAMRSFASMIKADCERFSAPHPAQPAVPPNYCPTWPCQP